MHCVNQEFVIMPRLICLSGLNKGEEYNLSPGVNTIGRSEKNVVCVFDKKVSRLHCTIMLDDNGATILDNESTNGSKVNNIFIKGPDPLKVGDHIRLGQTVFLFSDHSVTNKSEKPREQEDAEFDQLLQEATFQVTKTTALRKLRTDKEGKVTGFLSFFTKEDMQKNQQPPQK